MLVYSFAIFLIMDVNSPCVCDHNTTLIGAILCKGGIIWPRPGLYSS